MNHRYFIAASAALTVTCTMMTPTEAMTFPDVQQGTELGDAIYALANEQIINGYPDGQFKADFVVTRGQVAKIIASALKLDVENIENPDFQDVPTDYLFYPHIAALANIGVFNSSVSHFHPEQPMTRAQVAKVLTIAFDLPSVGQHPFQDVNEDWSYYINALYSNRITAGAYPTHFDLNSPVTRGQLALFIHRLQKQLEQVQVTFTSAQFEHKPIAASIVSGYHNEQALYIEEDANAGTITIRPNDLGSAYVYVGAVDSRTNEWIDTPHLYLFTSSLMNGQLHLSKELQAESIYAPVQLPIYDGVTPFSFTYANGQPVAAESIIIESKRNEFDGEQEHSIWLKDVYGELLVSYTNREGLQKEQAVFIKQQPYYLEATVGEYVTTGWTLPLESLAKYGLPETIIDSKVFEAGLESSKVKIQVTEQQLTITPNAEGEFTIYFVDATYRLHPLTLKVQSFAKGFLVQIQA